MKRITIDISDEITSMSSLVSEAELFKSAAFQPSATKYKDFRADYLCLVHFMVITILIFFVFELD